MFVQKRVYAQFIVLFGLSGLLCGCEAISPSADQLFINFSHRVPLIIQLIHATAALVGFLFIFRAFLKLKIYGEMRSMMAPHGRLSHILLLLFVGIVLISLPNATTSILLDAFFGNPTIKELQYDPYNPLLGEMQYAAKRIVQLIGSFALTRGIIQLGSYQEGGRHSLGKSMTHIIAGIFAINVQQSLDLLMNFLV